MLLLGRIFFALVLFFALWIGGAQLGVALLGPENDGIILFGVVGMFAGVGAAFRILTPKT